MLKYKDYYYLYYYYYYIYFNYYKVVIKEIEYFFEKNKY